MMQGSVRAMLGVTSRAISQKRISAACRRVAPDALNARTRDTLIRTNPVPHFSPYFGYKGHFDQNEKIAQTFGCTHVMFVDGCSRFICSLFTIIYSDQYCSDMDYLIRSEWITDKSFACVCLFRNFLKNTDLTKGECHGVRHSLHRIM